MAHRPTLLVAFGVILLCRTEGAPAQPAASATPPPPAVAAPPSAAEKQATAIESALSLERKGRYSEAADAYRQALGLGESCEAARNLFRLVIDRGFGSMQEARDLFDRAQKLGCPEAKDYERSAKLAELMGKPDIARKHYEAGYRLDPANPDTAKRYGGFLEREGRVDDAIAVYDEHLRRVPSDAIFYFFRAGCLARKGSCDEARRWLDAFLHYAMDLPRLAATIGREAAFKGCLPSLDGLLKDLAEAEKLRAEARKALSEGAPPDRVIDVLDRAVKEAPEWAILWRDLAELYLSRNGDRDMERALYANENYLRLCPYAGDTDDVRRLDDELRARILKVKR